MARIKLSPITALVTAKFFPMQAPNEPEHFLVLAPPTQDASGQWWAEIADDAIAPMDAKIAKHPGMTYSDILLEFFTIKLGEMLRHVRSRAKEICSGEGTVLTISNETYEFAKRHAEATDFPIEAAKRIDGGWAVTIPAGAKAFLQERLGVTSDDDLVRQSILFVLADGAPTQ